MGAFFSLVYGLVVYALFLATFLYAIAFTGNLLVPKSIDTGALAAPLAQALILAPDSYDSGKGLHWPSDRATSAGEDYQRRTSPVG